MTKVSCPSCAARYNVPDEKLGKRVKCAKCGERFELSPPPPPEDDFGFPGLEALQTGEAVVTIPLPPPPSDDAPARAGGRGGRGAAGGPADLLGVGAVSAYMTDVLGFFKILMKPWELITLFLVCGMCVLQVVAGFAGCLGFIAQIIITGWYLSFLLKTVQGGAARDEGLPELTLSDGFWEDIVIPCLSFLSVRLLVIVPLIAALIFAMNDGGLESQIAWAIGFLGVAMPEMALVMSFQFADEFPKLVTIVAPALLLGLAAAPMLVLVVAIGGIPALSRIDLMAQTIARTLPGYALATAIYLGSLGLAVGVAYAAEEAVSGGSSSSSRGAVTQSPPPSAAPGPAPSAKPKTAAPGSTSAPASSVSDPNAASDPNSASDPNMPVAGGGSSGSGRDLEREFMGSLGGQVIGTLVSVLASVFAMRAIGLYYAHFKKNFAWSWG